MSSSYSAISVSSIRLAPELGTIIVTVDSPADARRLADGINAARRRVLQVSLHRIRLLGVGRNRAVAFDLSVPSDLTADVNPAAIRAVHFAAQGGKRHVATVNLGGVEVYVGEDANQG